MASFQNTRAIIIDASDRDNRPTTKRTYCDPALRQRWFFLATQHGVLMNRVHSKRRWHLLKMKEGNKHYTGDLLRTINLRTYRYTNVSWGFGTIRHHMAAGFQHETWPYMELTVANILYSRLIE